MMDFYVISKNDSQGDVFGRGFLAGYWVDSRAVCFAVCTNSCRRERHVLFVTHFFPSQKILNIREKTRFPAHFNL